MKEDADDYRYFPEPDLVPLDPTAEDIARIDAALPVLPAARRAALADAAGRRPDARRGRHRRGARASTSSALGAIAAGADADRVLTHVEHNLAVDGADVACPPRHFADARADGDRRRAHRHPGQGRAGRDGRDRQGPRRDRGGEGLRGDGHRRARGDRRRGHRRPPGRVGSSSVDGRRQGPGQAHRVLHGQGDAGLQGPGRRQGRHRPAALAGRASEAAGRRRRARRRPGARRARRRAPDDDDGERRQLRRVADDHHRWRFDRRPGLGRSARCSATSQIDRRPRASRPRRRPTSRRRSRS